MKQQPFGKFQGEKGSKKKERFRQEKKQARKEKKEYFENKKAEERAARGTSGTSSHFDRKTSRSASSNSLAKKSRFSFDASEESKQGIAKKTYESRDRVSRSVVKPTTADARKTVTSSNKPSAASGSRGVVKSAAAGTGNTPTSYGKSSATGNSRGISKPSAETPRTTAKSASAPMPLNKFVAHAGICSRRDAAELVKSGKVTVNGEAITEPGFKVNGTEDIRVSGKKISAKKNLVYILLNKPKDFITTMEDPEGRKTVFDIVKKATPERIYPIGRLDRNTTGVLLMTNDGELAQKLSHPSYQVKKIYEVKLDRPLAKKDFDALHSGVTLEDGFIAPDSLAYADAKDKSVIGMEIHSGRNRIVRRIFEHLGYDVRNLDRVMYANLTKKNVERGKWRFLSEKEVRLLKFLNASYTRK